MKILADSAIPWLDKLFARHGEIVCFSGRKLDQSQLRDVDILLIRSTLKITGDLLKNTPVKFVGSATVGCDHVDEIALQELSIKFAYAPGCNANAVSEYVVSAIAWHEKERIICFDDDLTAAVIGCGTIGSKVKQKLEILDFDVVVNDPLLEHQGAKNLNFVDLDQALQADVICMHTPLTKNGDYPTFHLLEEKLLERINPNAILINAGRGEVINNPALLGALERMPGLNVVLDVWEDEPNINQELLQKVNLGTPHIAGHSWRGKVMGTVMLYQQACNLFGWQSQAIDKNDFKLPLKPLTITSKLRLYDLVAQCYDIECDTTHLRSSDGEQYKQDTISRFDFLRKNYYQRPEFSDLQCYGQRLLNETKLDALGFDII